MGGYVRLGWVPRFNESLKVHTRSRLEVEVQGRRAESVLVVEVVAIFLRASIESSGGWYPTFDSRCRIVSTSQ